MTLWSRVTGHTYLLAVRLLADREREIRRLRGEVSRLHDEVVDLRSALLNERHW